ncbi:GP158 protein, partial [Scytalopus superciliaris]|nr:GP158 protein [Scytalopus superciliaris]
CWPCHPGCATCEDDKPCLIQEDQVLRAAVLSCQACCMLAIFLSMLVSYHFRRSKARIRASGIILLETILFGSLLLYFPVFILYFKPSIFRCIVLRWVRMLGFATVYGTITLKLYRVNVPGWMRGGPSGQQPHPAAQHPWVPPRTRRGQQGDRAGCSAPLPVLSPPAEMLFLLWGSFLCYATRSVPSAFHEPRYMGIALHNELMISAAFHVVRGELWVLEVGRGLWVPCLGRGSPGTSGTPQWCPRPQFLHTGSPLREEITAEVYEDELDMRRSGSCMNSSIASAWSEHSLDPDDIREELKKLYRQLEVHKTWRMAANNPHLPRRRSSRRSLARSLLR